MCSWQHRRPRPARGRTTGGRELLTSPLTTDSDGPPCAACKPGSCGQPGCCPGSHNWRARAANHATMSSNFKFQQPKSEYSPTAVTFGISVGRLKRSCLSSSVFKQSKQVLALSACHFQQLSACHVQQP